MAFRPLAVEDNAQGRLNAGISAGATSIPLQAGQGALFPATKNGSATSGGTAIALNSTGIQALGVAIGDIIENVTDGSYAVVRTVSTNSITTSPLVGGSTNLWNNTNVWAVGRFVITVVQYDTDGVTILKREKVLIRQRSTDTLTVETSGRGYDGSSAQTFNTSDYVYVFTIAVVFDGIKKMLTDMLETVTTKADDSAVIKKDGTVAFTGDQSMGSYKLTNVTDPSSNQDAATKLYVDGKAAKFGGDGTDGALNVTSGTTTLSFASAATLEKNYTSFNISVGATLAFSNPYTYGSVFIGRSQTTGTIAGTLDLSGMGAAGGTASSDGTAQASGKLGNNGGAASDCLQPTSTSLAGNSGVGGGNYILGAAGGAKATIPVNVMAFFKIQVARVSFAMPGAGGGSGGGGGNNNNSYGDTTSMGDGGAGGRGGGGFILEFNGNCTLTGILNTSGLVGGAGTASTAKDLGGGGAGGGGAAGIGRVLYAGTLSDSSTKTVAGGAGATGGLNANIASWNTTGYGGGGGGGGASAINAGVTGNAGTSSSTQNVQTGGNSGAGGAGEITVTKVQG